MVNLRLYLQTCYPCHRFPQAAFIHRQRHAQKSLRGRAKTRTGNRHHMRLLKQTIAQIHGADAAWRINPAEKPRSGFAKLPANFRQAAMECIAPPTIDIHLLFYLRVIIMFQRHRAGNLNGIKLPGIHIALHLS